MTVLIKVLVFILGMYLCMRLIAALYGIIDFRYTIKTAYQKVIVNILFWGALIVLAALLLGGCRRAFIWGLAVYPFLYIAHYLSMKLLPPRRSRPSRTG